MAMRSALMTGIRTVAFLFRPAIIHSAAFQYRWLKSTKLLVANRCYGQAIRLAFQGGVASALRIGGASNRRHAALPLFGFVAGLTYYSEKPAATDVCRAIQECLINQEGKLLQSDSTLPTARCAEDFSFEKFLGKGCSGLVFSATLKGTTKPHSAATLQADALVAVCTNSGSNSSCSANAVTHSDTKRTSCLSFASSSSLASQTSSWSCLGCSPFRKSCSQHSECSASWTGQLSHSGSFEVLSRSQDLRSGEHVTNQAGACCPFTCANMLAPLTSTDVKPSKRSPLPTADSSTTQDFAHKLSMLCDAVVASSAPDHESSFEVLSQTLSIVPSWETIAATSLSLSTTLLGAPGVHQDSFFANDHIEFESESSLGLEFVTTESPLGEAHQTPGLSSQLVVARGGETLIRSTIHEQSTLLCSNIGAVADNGLAAVNSNGHLAIKILMRRNGSYDENHLQQLVITETLPLRLEGQFSFASETSRRSKRHPNLVRMFEPFYGPLPSSLAKSVATLVHCKPQRGDSADLAMTAFLPMKLYSMTLREHLDRTSDSRRLQSEPYAVSISNRLIAQLLEAVVYLTSCGVAHRDLKSDNILLESCGCACDLRVRGSSHGHRCCPRLVVSDFGCATLSLGVSYEHKGISKGGNVAHMAPEIRSVWPGRGVVLDYAKADVWAAGLIAHEIMVKSLATGANFSLHCRRNRAAPFGCIGLVGHHSFKGDSKMVSIVRRMLDCHPKCRLSAAVAADLIQLHLWLGDGSLAADLTLGTPAAKAFLMSMAAGCVLSTVRPQSATTFTGTRRYCQVDADLRRCFLERSSNIHDLQATACLYLFL